MQIVSGYSFVLILYSNNLYIQGRFGYIDYDNKLRKISLEHITNEKIIKISAGNYHFVFLTENGNVFGCGCNISGQIGYDDNLKDFEFFKGIKKINVPFKVRDVHCCKSNTFFQNIIGEIYVIGKNDYRKFNKMYDFLKKPQKVTHYKPKNIIKIDYSYSFYFILYDNKELFIFTEDGVKTYYNVSYVVHRMNRLIMLHDGYLNELFFSKTKEILTRNIFTDKIIAMGRYRNGLILQKNESEIFQIDFDDFFNKKYESGKIKKLHNRKIEKISDNDYDFYYIVSNEKEIFFWGNNKMNQISPKEIENFKKFTTIVLV